MIKFNNVLVTGAAGGIGQVLRTALRPHCRLLRCADIVRLDAEAENEEVIDLDVRDARAVHAAMAGIDVVYHFGGIPVEDDWAAIRDTNIDGTYNIYEAARQQGVKRVVFASSNHVLGFRRRTDVAGPDEPPRPDSRYGVSKVLGEALGRLYADKFGIQTISLRIGQFRPQPTNRRMLSLWLSPADMARLAIACLTCEAVHYEVVYGISANQRAWYDNPGAIKIGYLPQDDAEHYAPGLTAQALQENEVEARFQGGPFCSDEFGGALQDID